MAFSFGFSGDDIDDVDAHEAPQPTTTPAPSAFPVPGKPQLPAAAHSLADLLARLPSKVAYSSLSVQLDDGTAVQLPRRELWDVRVQLMAEEDGDAEAAEGLGKHDVKTGVYEGGFKSWESSVDLVKVLAADPSVTGPRTSPLSVMELGCGTALPSLALFQWAMAIDAPDRGPTSFVVADYNPTVLQLVTLPNFVLAWALHHRHSPLLQEAFTLDGELELTPDVLQAFQAYLASSKISLSFISGAWSPEFVQLLYAAQPARTASSLALVLGAETIYSPFALQAFTEVVFDVLNRERAAPESSAAALVAAKRLYFGVGGSLDDFVDKAQSKGAVISTLREETEGVRRGVVRCVLGTSDGAAPAN
ncbi:hypothetical protein S7711_08194 [Stachybotrys chartarum IBT 7711]|uniref:protein-histidine N-methyltransferase n=1 Tax=Stachybotrys chartarum (strain CBS 109288 / IBT 7711) TaxID=1280523 RepID=A0A084AI24_STACB|nr:hypothetical protein S7711_08194 [Stachybotrys chartarum IBT 7711]KFA51776.1 hypothetical protein S40293_05871 [Stachybotrys chartarum IBT 40293]